ncbi:hypothetical protein ACOTC5_29375 [Achromobacter xylosoxidans]
MQTCPTPHHMTAASQARRRAAARLFDQAAQSLDEAFVSAEATAKAMEHEGRLMQAPLLFTQTAYPAQPPAK